MCLTRSTLLSLFVKYLDFLNLSVYLMWNFLTPEGCWPPHCCLFPYSCLEGTHGQVGRRGCSAESLGCLVTLTQPFPTCPPSGHPGYLLGWQQGKVVSWVWDLCWMPFFLCCLSSSIDARIWHRHPPEWNGHDHHGDAETCSVTRSPCQVRRVLLLDFGAFLLCTMQCSWARLARSELLEDKGQQTQTHFGVAVATEPRASPPTMRS